MTLAHPAGTAGRLALLYLLLLTTTTATTAQDAAPVERPLGLMTREHDAFDDYPLADDSITQHHDCEPLPNGNVLVIVWEWHAWDHLIQDLDERRSNYGVVADHPELIELNADVRAGPQSTEQAQRDADLAKQMRELGYVGGGDAAGGTHADNGPAPGPSGRATGDWLHTNSIDYHAGLDLILLSTPRLHEIWVIDHSTSTEEAAGHTGGRWAHGGDLLYRWGNPFVYHRGRPTDRQLFAQHDARWLTGTWTGSTDTDLRVTVFNNGQARIRTTSSQPSSRVRNGCQAATR